MSQSDNILEFKPTRGKWMLLLTICVPIAFYGLVLLGLGYQNGRPLDFLLGIFFLLFSMIGGLSSFMALLPRRMSLFLLSDGLTFGKLWRRSYYKWGEILAIDIVGRRIRLSVREGDSPEKTVFLPDSYQKKPDELAGILEDWKRKSSQIDPFDTHEMVLLCLQAEGRPYPQMHKFPDGLRVLAFRTYDDGQLYLANQNQGCSLVSVVEALRQNLEVFSTINWVLYLPSPDAVIWLLSEPRGFPYAKFTAPFPRELISTDNNQ